MGVRARTTMHFPGDAGEVVTYRPGDPLPAELAARVVEGWAGVDDPPFIVDEPATVPAPADAPGPQPAPFAAALVLLAEAASAAAESGLTLADLEQRAAAADPVEILREPPRAGPTGSRAAWAHYATILGVDVPDGASRNDIIGLVDAARAAS